MRARISCHFRSMNGNPQAIVSFDSFKSDTAPQHRQSFSVRNFPTKTAFGAAVVLAAKEAGLSAGVGTALANEAWAFVQNHAKPAEPLKKTTPKKKTAKKKR